MGKLLDTLQSAGCVDMKTTIGRFLGDETFYLDVTKQALSDPGFDRLGQELQNGDAKKAFEAAHMIKGVMANCGITPVYNQVIKLVEPLRCGNTEGLMPLYDRMMEERKRFSDLLNSWIL